MRLKYWAFLIVLAVDLILLSLAFFSQDEALRVRMGYAWILVSILLFIATVDILVEAIKKRRAYRSFAISITVVSLFLILLGAFLWYVYEWDYAPIIVGLGVFMLFLLLIVACALSYIIEKNKDSLWDAIGSSARAVHITCDTQTPVRS